MTAFVTAPHLDVDALLSDPGKRIIVCTGSGGVGKTTTAAALGVRAAGLGRSVCVLTIDPARRLAQAFMDPVSRDGVDDRAAWNQKGAERAAHSAAGSPEAGSARDGGRGARVWRTRDRHWQGAVPRHAARRTQCSATLTGRRR